MGEAEGSGIDIERLVEFPTWKKMLLDLAVKEDFDPWNIDISEIAEKYIERIKKMKTLDLHVPANLILAASILLRFKSDTIRIDEGEEQAVEDEMYIGEEGPPVEIPMLTIARRIPPKRKVTLRELIEAVEKVFEEQKRRAELRKKVKIPRDIIIELRGEDIGKRMRKVYEKVKKKADEKGLATLSQLTEGDRKKTMENLIPLLFLTKNGTVDIFQEEFFSEIFIQLLKGKKVGG